jgi:hypothetical protein
MIDADRLKETVEHNIVFLCHHFFPEGKREGQEWKIGDISGKPGESLGIQLSGPKAGLWHDRATGQGGTFVDLLMAHFGVTFPQATEMIGSAIGVNFNRETTSAPPKAKKPKPFTHWDETVANVTVEAMTRLADWRGLSIEYVQWLHEQRLVGLHHDSWAFPVIVDGALACIHYRIEPKNEGNKVVWKFEPAGFANALFVIGDLAQVEYVHAFESQWDMFAVDDVLRVHESKKWALVSTRGASNAKLLANLPSTIKGVKLWAQTDPPGQKWLSKAAGFTNGCIVKSVQIPKDFKDVAEWVKAGANNEALDAANKAAAVVFERVPQSDNGEQDYTDNELKELTEKINEYYKFDDQNFPQPMEPSAYYGLAGEVVNRIEPESEAAKEAILSQFLVGVGNIVGRGPYKIQGARHHLNEFCVLVGETSFGRKGTAWYGTENLLGCLDLSWLAERIQDGFPSGESIISAVRDPRTFKTKKGQEHDPGIDDKRLLILEEEFSQYLTTAARPGNTLSSMTRKAWDAKMYLRNAGKNSPEKATGAHISLIGHITRSELLKVIQEIENQNGFSNRILWIATYRRQIIPEPKPIDWQKDHQDIVERLTEIIETFTSREKTEMRWSAMGSVAWDRFYRSFECRGAGILGSIIARSVAHVLRLTMIYTVLDHSALMEPQHLEAAIAFWGYCVRSAQWIFRQNTGNKLADRIYWELCRNPRGLTREEIKSNVCSRNYSKTVIDQALSELVKADLAYMVLERTKNARKPTQRWLKKEGE